MPFTQMQLITFDIENRGFNRRPRETLRITDIGSHPGIEFEFPKLTPGQFSMEVEAIKYCSSLARQFQSKVSWSRPRLVVANFCFEYYSDGRGNMERALAGRPPVTTSKTTFGRWTSGSKKMRFSGCTSPRMLVYISPNICKAHS